ncbi:hypothetical protein EON80_10825 [bacterium]|nr:MAG: hypothetical protein EON80_10825 [bacterium]
MLKVKSALLLSFAFLPVQAYAQTLPPTTAPQAAITPAKNLRIRVLYVGTSTVYQLEARNQNLADIFEAIGLAGDFRMIVDPVLQQSRINTVSITALSFPEMMKKLTKIGNSELVQTPSGTYFVGATTTKSSAKLPLEDAAARKSELLGPRLPTFNPFGRGSIKIKPQPHWEKFPFNDEDVYFIPLPVPNLSRPIK